MTFVENHYWPDDHTIQISTDTSWEAFCSLTLEHVQGLPLFYPSHWTLNDIFSSDWPSISTGLGGRYPRDYVLGLSITDGAGVQTKAGGRVMKNVTGYDVCRLMVGSFTSLGTIHTLTLKLITLPKRFTGYWFTFASQQQALLFAYDILSNITEALWACEVVSNQSVGTHNTHRVFILASSEISPNVLKEPPTEVLTHQQALVVAGQLSAFGWEAPPTTPINPSVSSFLSGILAVSLGHVSSAMERIERWLSSHSLERYQIQCRPAAGLVLFSVSFNEQRPEVDWLALLGHLQQLFPELQMQPKQASLRITQWPACLTSAINALHLPPPNTPEALYYRRLKQLYDSDNHFQSPHLPLHLLNP